MLLEEIIKPDAVLNNAQARSKKHCIEILSELLVRSHPEIPSDDIFENLIERERLGCTSLDKGVAFPHCRVDGLDDSVGALILLSEPVEFDSVDGEPVDLVFGLMVPAKLDDRHVEHIRSLTTMLGDESARARLRATSTSSELYDVLTSLDTVPPASDLQAAQGS